MFKRCDNLIILMKVDESNELEILHYFIEKNTCKLLNYFINFVCNQHEI